MPRKKAPTATATRQKRYRTKSVESGNPTDREVSRALCMQLARVLTQHLDVASPWGSLPPALLQIIEGAETELSLQKLRFEFDYRGRIVDYLNSILDDKRRGPKLVFEA
jgi:hypothetical protein